MSIAIRTARAEDAGAIAEIYRPYVERTAITFDYEAPSAADFADRISRIEERFPFLVAEEERRVVAYAYASAFKDRAAYDRSVELSVYCAMGERGRGAGSALCAALEDVLARQGVLNVNACIAFPASPDEYLDEASVCFHEARGYSMVGAFHSCGYKFGRWYDMVWMEKALGEHGPEPAAFVPFPLLPVDEVEAAIMVTRR